VILIQLIIYMNCLINKIADKKIENINNQFSNQKISFMGEDIFLENYMFMR